MRVIGVRSLLIERKNVIRGLLCKYTMWGLGWGRKGMVRDVRPYPQYWTSEPYFLEDKFRYSILLTIIPAPTHAKFSKLTYHILCIPQVIIPGVVFSLVESSLIRFNGKSHFLDLLLVRRSAT